MHRGGRERGRGGGDGSGGGGGAAAVSGEDLATSQLIACTPLCVYVTDS